MKWTFEQKLSWAKAYMDGEFVPVPEGFSRSMGRWHDKVREWARVLSEYGEEGLISGAETRVAAGIVLLGPFRFFEHIPPPPLPKSIS